MEKKKSYLGNHRRNTPQSRLKRAVAYRHAYPLKSSGSPSVLSMFSATVSQTFTKYLSSVKEKVVQWTEADANEEDVPAASQANGTFAEQTDRVADITILTQHTAPHKLTRKEKKDLWVTEMVTQPNASFFGTLVHPLHSIPKAAASSYISIGLVKGFIWYMLAWLCFGLCAAQQDFHKIDALGYSIARFNFTDSIWLAVRIALFGAVMLYLLIWAFSIYGTIRRKTFFHSKVMEGVQLASLPIGVALILCYLILQKSAGIGSFLFIVCIFAAGAYLLYSFHCTTKLNWMEIGILCAAGLIIAWFLYQLYYSVAMQDLIQIYKLLK